MKKKKKHLKNDLSSACVLYKDDCYFPKLDDTFINNSTNSWFDLTNTKSEEKIVYEKNKSSNLKKDETIIYSKKLLFLPTSEQIKILNDWFIDSITLYNKTLKILKSKMYYKTNDKPSFIQIRNEIKGVKKEDGRNKREKQCKSDIPVHILDCSIKDAVEMYKSALTNWRQKNIKRFRIRYQPYHKKNNKILHVEPGYIRKNGTITVLGECILKEKETNEYYKLNKEEIKKEFKIQWNAYDKQYYFIFSIERPISTIIKEKEKFISLDPGVSPFLSGVSETNAYFIGKDNYLKLKNKLDNIDKCEKSEISLKKKNKHNQKIRNKIKNMVNDMHWKTIKWITSNFNNILIGDMSAKGVVEGSIQKISKRILHCQRLFQFKQRLQFKCIENNVNYFEVNEFMTSKTCSCCGHIKEDLGLNKEYNCMNCGVKMHRDFNGARCIYNVWKMNN